EPLLETQPQRRAALRLAIGDDPPAALPAPGQTLRQRHGGFHTLPAVPIPEAHAQGSPSLSAYAETQAYLLELIPTLLALSRGRPGRPGRLWSRRLRARARQRAWR